MPLIENSGYYVNRVGEKVWVCPNHANWLDGLPFVVARDEGEAPRCTVNEDGYVYPECHKVFRDDAGYFQPDMFGNVRHTLADDIVAKWCPCEAYKYNGQGCLGHNDSCTFN